MNKAFEKILGFIDEQIKIEERIAKSENEGHPITHQYGANCMNVIKSFVHQVAEEYNGGWIPCSDRLPEVEKEVLILAKRKYRDEIRYIITTAMYEDGTVLENDSCWWWEDIEGEWSEEEDCYIIPEGWRENKHYNGDGELNHAVDDEVIAWQPLPEKYQPKGE